MIDVDVLPANHMKKMYDDYKYSCKETANLFKEKPVRMSAYAIIVTTSGYLFSTNPTMKDYQAHLADMTCDLAEVGEDLRNKQKNAQAQQLIYLQTQGRLRRFTIGVCSFIWYTDFPSYVDLYESQCKEVKMRWRDWPQYIVDIGIHGRWLWSEKYMIDFDINPDEWKHLDESDDQSVKTKDTGTQKLS